MNPNTTAITVLYGPFRRYLHLVARTESWRRTRRCRTEIPDTLALSIEIGLQLASSNERMTVPLDPRNGFPVAVSAISGFPISSRSATDHSISTQSISHCIVADIGPIVSRPGTAVCSVEIARKLDFAVQSAAIVGCVFRAHPISPAGIGESLRAGLKRSIPSRQVCTGCRPTPFITDCIHRFRRSEHVYRPNSGAETPPQAAGFMRSFQQHAS